MSVRFTSGLSGLPCLSRSRLSRRTQKLRFNGMQSRRQHLHTHEQTHLKHSGVGKQALLTLVTCGLAFGTAALVTNDETRRLAKRFQSSWSLLDSPPTSQALHYERDTDLFKAAKRMIRKWATDADRFTTRLLIISTEHWLNLAESQRTCVGLIALQGVIFLAWQISPLTPFMIRHFLSNPLSNRFIPNLNSTFSHYSLLHFGFNSFALYSIGSSAYEYLWSQQRRGDLPSPTARYEFLAFFLAGGLSAAFCSHAYSRLIKIPALIRSGQVVSPSTVPPSLGASGAIWSCLSLLSLAAPTSQVELLFLPFFAFPITYATGALVLADIVGLLRGWRYFDHAAHLGGALFGGLYFYVGPSTFESIRATCYRYIDTSKLQSVS